jgi:hypothetical protein
MPGIGFQRAGNREDLDMPIDYRIDGEQRLVVARAHGAVSREEMVAYQVEVWSRPEVAGFSELVDMTDADLTGEAHAEGLLSLAELSAGMDSQTHASRFAIVAPQDLFFGLGREYQVYRELSGGSTKEVGVFRTMDEALRWLAELLG